MSARFIYVILAIVISINPSVATAHSGVKAVMDEFTYVMTVEGAALDPQTAEETIVSFRARMLELNQHGVSREEIVDEALARVVDAKTAEEIKSALAQVQSQEEMNILLQEILLRGNQQGASWNGRNALQTMSTILLAGAIMGGFVYIFFLMPECDPNKEQCS